MKKTIFLSAALTALALVAAAPAAGSDYVPGQVIVKYRSGGVAAAASGVRQATGTGGTPALPGGSHRVKIRNGSSVREAVAKLNRDPGVAYAVPNYRAHASALYPNDPAFPQQWNFGGGFGINMPQAWDIARARSAPGGKGVTVAVLDTGVAYERRGRYRRAPDLNGFVKGYDFVGEDRHPNDLNGHGTHVSGTIAENTGNGQAAAGIAYNARIMPVRVLDADGAGDTISIARGIRFAAKRGAKIINLSLEFDASVRASQIPDIVSALRYARRKRVLVVAAAGNQADGIVAYPARARNVIAVAATTVHGCEAEYSNSGVDVDIAAPGGGSDAANADNAYDAQVCRPDLGGPFVYQQTFTTSVGRFGLPRGYEGTSMAAPHVSGTAALLVASGRLGKHPSPAALERQLEATARDIGPPGFDSRYGHGLLDAAAALR